MLQHNRDNTGHKPSISKQKTALPKSRTQRYTAKLGATFDAGCTETKSDKLEAEPNPGNRSKRAHGIPLFNKGTR